MARDTCLKTVATLVLVLVLGSSASRADERSEAVAKDQPRDGRLTEGQRKSALDAAVRAINDGQGALRPGDPRWAALKQLSTLRAPEAAAPLVRRIDLMNGGNILSGADGALRLEDVFPVAGTLAALGEPGARECLTALAAEQGQTRRELMCWVIATVHGKAKGRTLIEARIAKATTDSEVANLRESLSVYDIHHPKERPATE